MRTAALTGVRFEKVKAEIDEKGRRKLVPTGEPDVHMQCDDVLVAVGQENAFPWIERDIGLEFDRMGHAGGGPGHVSVDTSEGILWRRRRVRAEEYHLGCGAWSSGGDLDRPRSAAVRNCKTGRRRMSG